MMDDLSVFAAVFCHFTSLAEVPNLHFYLLWVVKEHIIYSEENMEWNFVMAFLGSWAHHELYWIRQKRQQ